MWSPSNTWARLGLLCLAVQLSLGEVEAVHTVYVNETTIYETCTSKVTVFDTTTIVSPTTQPVTHILDVTVPSYVNITYTSTEIDITTIVEVCTESTTTTLHYTVSTTEIDSATITNTETDSATITNTETDLTTITNTATTTITVPTTTTSTETVFTTTYDPCPDTCSLSVGTVNLFFWPTNRPYTYPATWYDPELNYIFTSPSVYMVIPTAVGTNPVQGRVGPVTSEWILPLNIWDVSTIRDGSITTQLTLSDLGTDCAQTADPTAIATMVDSRCDPILAAPKAVSSWAFPCNACGRFGLFDPPYAVSTVTGGLVVTTTATVVPAPTTVVPSPTPTSAPPVGTLLVVYYSDGTGVATATLETTGISGTVTSSVIVPAASTSALEATSTAVAATSTAVAESTTTSPSPTPTPATSSSVPVAFTSSTLPTSSIVTAAASKATSGLGWLASIAIAMLLW